MYVCTSMCIVYVYTRTVLWVFFISSVPIPYNATLYEISSIWSVVFAPRESLTFLVLGSAKTSLIFRFCSAGIQLIFSFAQREYL